MQLYQIRVEQTKRGRERVAETNVRFTLSVLGIEKSVAEALVLKSALAILKETGREGCVHINSVGDRDSIQRFSRELSSYLRKHVAEIPIPAREALKRDVFEALELLLAKEDPIAENAPRPMQFLTDASRRHLKDVLEFLEVSEIPYEINDRMIGNREFTSQTLFEIYEHNGSAKHEEPPVARGGRCEEFPRRIFKTNFPTVSIVLEEREKRARMEIFKPIRARHPKIYFIQLGDRAKLQSLSIIEQLRTAHIPILQNIGSDSLTLQLEDAQNRSVPFTLIMGQREVLDRTVIVRDMSTHAQETIAVDSLPLYLKSLNI
jgi:histidyl-tRNA synthetase